MDRLEYTAAAVGGTSRSDGEREGDLPRPLEPIRAYLSDWRFPVCVLSMLAGFVVLMLALLVLPTDAGAAGAFADSIRQWGFKYDSATGRLEWCYVWMYLGQPVVVQGIAVLVCRPERRF